MRNIIKILLIFGVIGSIAFSCEKNDEIDPNSIIGKWRWLGTLGDLTPFYPDEGLQIKVVFTKDSIYKRYINNELDFEGRFWTFNDTLEYVHPISADPDNHGQYNYEIRNDSLILIVDQEIFEYFKRIK